MILEAKGTLYSPESLYIKQLLGSRKKEKDLNFKKIDERELAKSFHPKLCDLPISLAISSL